MEKEKTSVFENGLIWFGAAVSLAEIVSGTSLATLGFAKAVAAVILGHILGCALMLCAGLLGARSGKSAMETVKMTFGGKGGLLFAVLNVVQLVGWTSIMIYDGAVAARGIFGRGLFLWAIVIGALIVVWLLLGVRSLGRVNVVAMGALFVLTCVLGGIIFKNNSTLFAAVDDGSLGFGEAVELSAAMPISWLPLISDYTSTAEKPARAALVSTVVYGLVSCFMYIIGIGGVLCAGSGDIAAIMAGAGLGIFGLFIVIFSTVTTTFLDAYSAGVSATAIHGKISAKRVGIGAVVLGTICACLFNMDNISTFLYFIGSVFTPMIGVMIGDSLILKTDRSDTGFAWPDLIAWLVGFLCYRYFLSVTTPVGETLPTLGLTVALSLVFGLFLRSRKSR